MRERKKIECTCHVCGAIFEIECDYLTPGINGWATDKNGNEVRFVDPDEPRACHDCIESALEILNKKVTDEC